MELDLLVRARDGTLRRRATDCFQLETLADSFLYLHPIYDNDVSLGRQAFLQTDFTTAQYHYVSRENIVAGVPGFVLSTVFLFAPLLFLLRRWRLPVGAAVVVLGLQSLLMQGLTG